MMEIPEVNLNIEENQETVKQSKQHFAKIGGAFFLGTLIVFGVQYLMSYIQAVFFPESIGNYDIVLIVSSFSMYLLGMPFIVLFVRKIPKVVFYQHKMSVGKWFIAFFMSYALMYISNLIGVLTTGILGVITGEAVSNPIQDIAMELSPLTALFLMVICAPIVEEYIFRKLIIDRSVRYGEKTAIVLSGLMFAMFHGNLNQFVYAFGLGIFFGFIYVKTGKLIYVITLHMAVNFMGSIPGILLLKSEAFTKLANVSGTDTGAMMSVFTEHMPELMLYLLYLIFILTLVITGIVFWALSFKKMKCVPAEIEIPKGRWFSTVILNVGMGLYCLFWIVQMVMQIIG